MGVDRLFDLQPHGRPESSPHEFAFEGKQKILCIVLFDFDVLIARDAEGVMLSDFHPREEFIEMCGDDVFERNEALSGDFDEPGQRGRHLHPGEEFGAGYRIAHHDCEVE